jgi:hypothetical protein
MNAIRQLDYWATNRYVEPSIEEAAGSGSPRLWSYEDLVDLRLVRELLDDGRELTNAVAAVIAYRKAAADRGSDRGLFLLSDPTVGWEAVDEAEIDATRLSVVTIVSVEWIRAETESALFLYEAADRQARRYARGLVAV